MSVRGSNSGWTRGEVMERERECGAADCETETKKAKERDGGTGKDVMVDGDSVGPT